MKRGSDVGFGDRFDDEGRPVLITTAAPSYEEEHRARVRKYLTLMAFRVPALILAAVAYGAWHNGLISLLIVAASVPLPWMAVLIANDRPPSLRRAAAVRQCPAAHPAVPDGRTPGARAPAAPGATGAAAGAARARRPGFAAFRVTGRSSHFSGHSQVAGTFPHVKACEMAPQRELPGRICR